MDISAIMSQNLQMIQSAVKMSMMAKANNQGSEAMMTLLQGMAQNSEGVRAMELSVNPAVGQSIDVSV